jgi:hypothetical protein
MKMKRMLVNRIGNRGLALGLLGVLWILMALGVAIAPLRREELLDEHLLPVWARAALWAGPGFLALAALHWRKFDASAWGWLMVPAAVRFLSYLIGWVSYLAGYEEFAYRDGWRGATTIAVFVVFIRICAAGLGRQDPQVPEASWTGDR